MGGEASQAEEKMKLRQEYQMSEFWYRVIRGLRTDSKAAGIAFTFWKKMGDQLGFDYKSVLPHPDKSNWFFTALPLDHGKHWCYPVSLKCKQNPNEVLVEVE
jgi:hypothetical protein